MYKQRKTLLGKHKKLKLFSTHYLESIESFKAHFIIIFFNELLKKLKSFKQKNK